MTLWTVFTDVSLMGALLILGQLMRAKIKIFQKLLIPPSLIAGFLALAFGPSGMNIIKFSDSLGTYASVLIVVVFAAMPIGDKPGKQAMSGKALGGMFINVTGIAVLQYAVGMLVSLYVLNLFYDLNPGFGLMMATGFYGGHGTAAAVGQAYLEYGWEEASALGYTTATVGIVGGILFGIIIINWGARRGYTSYVSSPKDLPVAMRTGLVPPEEQKPIAVGTVSTICMDPFAFHLGLVLIASLAGDYAAKILKPIIGVSIPAFCTALLFGFLLNGILNKTGACKYVDRNTVSRVSSTATDFLMVSGIGSLQLGVVFKYAVPLIVVCVVGFLVNWLWFLLVGRYSSAKDWFERNMMVWGHACGVAATGVMLQRIVDPDLKSRGIEDSGIADLINRPLIIGLQILPPLIMATMPVGGPHIVAWSCLGITIAMLVIAKLFGWWEPPFLGGPKSQASVNSAEK